MCSSDLPAAAEPVPTLHGLRAPRGREHPSEAHRGVSGDGHAALLAEVRRAEARGRTRHRDPGHGRVAPGQLREREDELPGRHLAAALLRRNQHPIEPGCREALGEVGRHAPRVLELAATEGLNQSLVGEAELRVGQGLVGRIAKTGEPVNTDDAVNEPGFLLIPGIGEEEFRSFLGAPIMRHGHMLGVLVVQNRAPRRYDEDELDALELIAMVIAEMTEAGALVDPNKQGLSAAGDTWPWSLPGGAACEGVAISPVGFVKLQYAGLAFGLLRTS